MVRALLAALVVPAALIAPGTAAAALPARQASSLEPAAAWVAGRQVEVWCTAGEGEGYGFYDPASGRILLGPDICAALRARQRGAAPLSAWLATSLLALAHEARHAARPEQDEAKVECDALHYVPGIASRFFGFTSWRSRHELMALVWQIHRRQPPGYRTLC